MKELITERLGGPGVCRKLPTGQELSCTPDELNAAWGACKKAAAFWVWAESELESWNRLRFHHQWDIARRFCL